MIGLPDGESAQARAPQRVSLIVVLYTIEVGNFISPRPASASSGWACPSPPRWDAVHEVFTVLYSGLWWVSIPAGLYIMLIVSINLSATSCATSEPQAEMRPRH